MISRAASVLALVAGGCASAPASSPRAVPSSPAPAASDGVIAQGAAAGPAVLGEPAMTTAGVEVTAPEPGGALAPATTRLGLAPPARPDARYALRRGNAAEAAILVADATHQNVMVRGGESRLDLDVAERDPDAALDQVATTYGLFHASHDGWHVLASTEAIGRWTAHRGPAWNHGRLVDLYLCRTQIDDAVSLLLPLASATRSGRARGTVTIWARNVPAGQVLSLLCAIDDCAEKDPRHLVYPPGPDPVAPFSADLRNPEEVALGKAPIATLRVVGVALTTDALRSALITDGIEVILAKRGDLVGRTHHYVTAIDPAGVELSPVRDP